MSLLLIGLIVLGVAATAVAVMYAVRRRSQSATLVTDFDRTGGVFSFVGTAFAVLIAFVIFQAFHSYSTARDAAGSEAIAVQNLAHLADFFDPADRKRIQGSLDCYGRAVAHDEWPVMRDGDSSALVEDWILRLRRSFGVTRLKSPMQQTAFQGLLDEGGVRSAGRTVRIGEAHPVIQPPIWFILLLGGVLTIVCTAMFIDRRDSFLVEGILMGATSALVAASLLLVYFLDHPYEDKSGSIKPTAMEESIRVLENENPALAPPCNATGEPRLRPHI
jgi:hypothetical protein